jgi:hypothetical protein
MYNTGKSGKAGAIKKLFISGWPFLLCVLIFLSIKFAARNTGLVDQLYSLGIYPIIAKTFSSVSSHIPFSLWDIFWLLILFLIISGLVLVVLRRIKFSRYILRTLQLFALLYSFFYLAWGYNYFRPGIEKRIGWKSPKAYDTIFRSVLDSIISQTNQNYISVSTSDYLKIDTLVEKSYSKNGKYLGIRYPNGTRRPKTMIFSSFFGKLGVNGYFGPFFNEIHINSYLLPVDYPFVLAHEKAHQFGITSEAEANLAAFIICIKSGDQKLRYSGYQSLLLYFLKDASQIKEYREYIDKIDKRIIQDLRSRQKYYLGLENKNMSDMQSAVNDAYLKANKIEKGVKNYDQAVSLVISWYYNSNLITE